MNDRQNRPSSPPPPPPAVFYIGVSAQAGGQEPGGGQGHGHQAGRQDGVPLVVSSFKNICPPMPLSAYPKKNEEYSGHNRKESKTSPKCVLLLRQDGEVKSLVVDDDYRLYLHSVSR